MVGDDVRLGVVGLDVVGDDVGADVVGLELVGNDDGLDVHRGTSVLLVPLRF